MSLQEAIKEVEVKLGTEYQKMEIIREDWAKDAAMHAYPENPSKVRDIETEGVRLFWNDDGNMETYNEAFTVRCRLGEYAYLTLKPDKKWDASTSGYYLNNDKDENISLEKLSEAFEMHKLMLKLFDFEWYNYCKETYLAHVINNDCYRQAKQAYNTIAKELQGLRDQLKNQEALERETQRSMMRVVGRLLIVKTHGFNKDTWRTRNSIDIGIVSQVTPQKIRVDSFGFYKKTDDETFDQMLARGLEYITKNKEFILTNRSGIFYKNECILADFEILSGY